MISYVEERGKVLPLYRRELTFSRNRVPQGFQQENREKPTHPFTEGWGKHGVWGCSLWPLDCHSRKTGRLESDILR